MSVVALPRSVRTRLRPLLLVLAILVVWYVLAVTVLAGHFVLPTPFDVVKQGFKDGLYLSDLGKTLSLAWKGWLIGNGAAILLAVLCMLVPAARSSLMTIGVATYCIPTVAVGPVLVVIYSPDGARIVMSALSCFFVTLVAAVAGLSAASPTMLDAVTAYGGNRWHQLRMVRTWASVPLLASGLSISAPASILGVMIGDYLGGDKGLGVAMLQAQQQLAVSRTWAIAVVTTIVCGLAFAATAFVARRLGARLDAPIDSAMQRPSNSAVPAWFRATMQAVGALLLGYLLWYVLVWSSSASSFFLKTPGDVWSYLVSGPGAGTARHDMLRLLGRTLADGGIGWAVGTVGAVVVALVLVLLPVVGAAVMPLVMVMRSVPLIAMCPLIGLVFGRGLLGVTVIAGIVTFVPSVVTLLDGLRSVPSAAADVVHGCGGSSAATLFKVRLPYSLPALFAAAKISMPGAVLGAVLAEWLITGKGMGHAMSYDVISSHYIDLWASMIVLMLVSLGLYAGVGVLEGVVRRRMTS